MKKIIITILYSFFALTTYANTIYDEAMQLPGDLDNGKKVYQMCAACHLQNGYGKINGSFPVIAAQHKSVIIKQLEDIQTKKRNNPTMFPFSDTKTIGGVQNIADVATYISNLPKVKNNGVGDGKNIALGKNLYNTKCAVCHKKDGSGNNINLYPRIKNQHYQYLVRQLKWMQSGYRKNTNPAMLTIIKDMTDAEFEAIADYVSRMK